MNKTNRFFNAAKKDNTLTLTVYDVIGADFFGNGITAQSVQEALDGDYSDITLRVNSPGGDAFAGVAIYNLLRAQGKPVNVIVDGLAASAASIIAMAGDSITMGTGSMMMIHPAQGMALGDAKEVREFAETLDKVSDSIADIYVQRTANSKKAVTDMMNAETWMNATEAQDKGFASSVSKQQAIRNEFDLSAFKNTPVELQAKAEEVEDVTPAVIVDDTWEYELRLKRIELEKRK